jgi:hypothetical protein
MTRFELKKRQVSLLIVCLILGGLFISVDAVAQEDEDERNSHLWEPSTKSVAVFKNGLGFFMREGEVELRDGWCVSGEIPPAAFGTLAIHGTDLSQTVDIVGSGPGEVVEFDGRDAPTDIESKRERLEACLHLRVQLDYEHHGQDRTAAGELVSTAGDFLVLENGQNSFAVPLEGVKKLQVLELPLRVHVSEVGEDDTVGDAQGTATLGMAYLREGITWIPEYTLKIIDEETAELTLRGTIINEAEDLIHTDVHLVVGVPHFVHTEYMAPIAVGQIIRTVGAAVAPEGVMNQMMQNSAIISNSNGFQNPAAQFGPGIVEQPVEQSSGDLSNTMGNLPQLDNSTATDYTVYTKSDLTLRRGEKAIVTLFRKQIKFSHIYRWNLPGRMQHSLLLHNDTDSAWTTGPCLALSEERPLTEDMLRYTPKGGRGELPMTAAINISHDRYEQEFDRELKAHNPRDTIYLDLVTLEGRLRLQSYETRPTTITIRCPVPGKPIEASEEGRMTVDSTQLQLESRAGEITWSITLEPGEERELTYKYERYVPSH